MIVGGFAAMLLIRAKESLRRENDPPAVKELRAIREKTGSAPDGES